MPQTPAPKSRAQNGGALGPLQSRATTVLQAANVQVLDATTVLHAGMVQAAETTKVLEDLIARLDNQIARLVKHTPQKNATMPLAKADCAPQKCCALGFAVSRGLHQPIFMVQSA